jgi:HEAT repeat protein/MFS family permease
MSAEPTNAEKLRRLPFVMAFDTFNSVFCNLSVVSGIFILFLSAMGMPKGRIGLIQSLLLFCGVISIFMAPIAAKVGVKRVFITFWGIRNIFAAAILAAPWVYYHYGVDTAFIFVAIMMGCFSMCRSLAEAASSLWRIEIIPNAIRGRFSALDNIVCTLGTVAALLLAGWYLGDKPSLNQFVWVMGVGSVVGVTSLLLAGQMPGGAAIEKTVPLRTHLVKMTKALRDRNFILYLSAVSLVTFGSAPLGIFVPLFLKDVIALPQDTIVKLPNGALIGTLLSSYFWGWAADRFGSKPVILTSLSLLLIPPIGWLLMPIHSAASVWVAGSIFVIAGVASIGYGVGTVRQLYVTLVPHKMRTQYMSVYIAWIGVTGGCGQVFASLSMDLLPPMSGQWWFLRFNEYTPLFIFSLVMIVLGLLLQRIVQADGSIPVGRFVSMFIQGNPLMAFESMLRYSRAGHDSHRVSLIHRMGKSRSSLNAEELIDALVDPSFNVRHEAIVAIARSRKDPALTGALIETLISGQPDLSVAAAWALARSGDESALPMLRWTLQSHYPLLRVRSARALADFGDTTQAGEIRKLLAAEPDAMIRACYADVLRTMDAQLLRQGESLSHDGTDHNAAVAMSNGAGSAWLLQRLRKTASPSQVDELAALASGRFDVQLEAVMLAGHCKPDSRITAALEELLQQGQHDLKLEAAWALAQVGDTSALPPLRRAFASEFTLLQARSARALANLGERRIVPELIRRLAKETDVGVRIAYASALGQLRAVDTVASLLAMHDEMPNSVWTSELNLAIARLAGRGRVFNQLWRQMHKDPGTHAAQALDKCLNKFRRQKWFSLAMMELGQLCSRTLAQQDLAGGGAMLAEFISQLPGEKLSPALRAIFADTQGRLRQKGWQQMEALVLAIYCIGRAAETPGR